MWWLKNKSKYKDEIWEKANDFDYTDHLDTIQFQKVKVCPWCGDAMIYDQFTTVLNNKDGLSSYNWTIGSILPLASDGAKNNIANLQAIHALCEIEKANDYTIIFGTDES